jgi:glycolate oxidase FAD binding subunit
MLTPHTDTEAAELVKVAGRSKLTLEIRGGGTKRGLGALVETSDILSTEALSGITAYNPAEMVMTARAGTPLKDILEALHEQNQMLAFEPADWRGIYGASGESTIGGLFACNLSGPRRFQAGAARDHLLGVRFVNGLGEIVNAGGRVMKNVTGLDIVKLMAGSMGTLGLMTELTFKVLPRPETSATLILSGLDDQAAAKAMAQALALSVEVSGAAHLPESCKWQFLGGSLPGGAATALRLEGMSFSVGERLDRLKAAFKGVALTVLDHRQATDLWRDIRDVKPFHADGKPRPLWKVSMAPSAGHQLLSALRLQIGIDGYYDWQGGLLWLRMEAGPEAEMLRAGIRHFGGGHATLMRATEAERQAIPGFEPQPVAAAALNARIREKFDPADVFNPGRMG